MTRESQGELRTAAVTAAPHKNSPSPRATQPAAYIKHQHPTARANKNSVDMKYDIATHKKNGVKVNTIGRGKKREEAKVQGRDLLEVWNDV